MWTGDTNRTSSKAARQAALDHILGALLVQLLRPGLLLLCHDIRMESVVMADKFRRHARDSVLLPRHGSTAAYKVAWRW